MKLFTQAQLKKLLENGKNRGGDHIPVVKLFMPDANFTWLISEVDPENNSFAFGLCDLDMGFPELGDVYLPEILTVKGVIGLSVGQDLFLGGVYPISVYVHAARAKDEITLDETFLRLKYKELQQQD